MKFFKPQFGSISLCLLEILVGILLLINPVGFTSGIIIACGIALLVSGLFFTIKYFRMDAKAAVQSQMLLKGLALLLIGGFCTLKSYWFIATFPLLTIVYGIATLVSGLGKIQWTFDLFRLKKKKWFLAGISAILSIICAMIILSNPFSTTAVLWMFTGISLIAEAVMDIVALIFSDKK